MSRRQTVGAGDALDAQAMLELLEGTGSDGGPTCTIDVKTFQDAFGPGPETARREKRRETVDPSQLKDLLARCVIEDGDESGEDAVAASPLPRRSPRFSGKKSRRMTCDPRLLKRLVLEHTVEAIPEEEAPVEDAPRRKTLAELAPPEDARRATLADDGDVRAAETREWAFSPAKAAPWSDEKAAPAAEGAAAEEDDDDDDEEEEEEDVFDARPVKGRSSVAWTFDETRANMQELRRQLEIEREVSRDAETERDELATELAAIKAEAAARADVVDAVEIQRDAASRRASTAESRAEKADAAAARKSHAADGRAESARAAAAEAEAVARDLGLRVVDAEEKADAAAAEADLLRETIGTLRARVADLEKVKMTAGFATKVRKVVAERDALLAEKHGKGGAAIAGKENAFAVNGASDADAAGECRQS